MLNVNANNSISFQGKLMRTTSTERVKTERGFERKTVEHTKQDLVESYDSQIRKLEAYKQFALKLDNLMYTDKDIREKIDSLPEDLEIEVAAELILDDCDNEREINLGSPSIIASNDEMFESIYLDDINEEPNKEKIMKWLDKINEQAE
jgi:hypothetical protein